MLWLCICVHQGQGYTDSRILSKNEIDYKCICLEKDQCWYISGLNCRPFRFRWRFFCSTLSSLLRHLYLGSGCFYFVFWGCQTSYYRSGNCFEWTGDTVACGFLLRKKLKPCLFPLLSGVRMGTDIPLSCFCPVLNLSPFNGYNGVKWQSHLHHRRLFVSTSTNGSVQLFSPSFTSMTLQESENSCTLTLKIPWDTKLFFFLCGFTSDEVCLCTNINVE